MELKEAIYGRRSAKSFLDKNVDPSLINTVVSYGVQAPSACNIQGWKFIIVEKEIRKWLIRNGSPPFIENPAGILVLYDNRTTNTNYNDHIQSASAAIQNMLLAAHSLGLGSCWICRLPDQSILRKKFSIPGYLDVIAYVALGYTKIYPKNVPRKYSLSEIVSKDKFKDKVTFSSVKRKAYLLTPNFMKKVFRRTVENIRN